jgi:hypothetical protein
MSTTSPITQQHEPSFVEFERWLNLEPRAYSRAEAVRLLGVSARGFDRLVRLGQLPAFRPVLAATACGFGTERSLSTCGALAVSNSHWQRDHQNRCYRLNVVEGDSG